MSLLELNQVKLIEADVENAKITLTHLSQELVDHICCEVEEHMSRGKSFEEAYLLVKEQTGIKVLQKIQESTLILIDKNYAIMKTTMKITGNISLALIAIGTVLKIWHWPGSALALLFGFTILCLVFFPAAIYLNYTYESERKKPILHLSILAGGIVFMAGVFFKVMHWPGASLLLFAGWSVILGLFLPILLFVKLKQAATGGEKTIYVTGVIALAIFELATMSKFFHWPGASVLLVLGSVLLFAVFLPLFIRMKVKRNELTNGQFIFIVTTSMYAVVLTLLLSLNVSENVLDRFVKNESNAGKIVNYFEKKNALIAAKSSSDTSSTQQSGQRKLIREGAGKVRKLITDIKLDLVRSVEFVDESTARNLIANPGRIMKLDNYDLVNQLMLGQNGEGMATVLKNELEKFRALAVSTDDKLAGKIEHLLNLSPGENNLGETIGWEDANFRNTMLIAALAQLSAIEEQVCLVESSVLNRVK